MTNTRRCGGIRVDGKLTFDHFVDVFDANEIEGTRRRVILMKLRQEIIRFHEKEGVFPTHINLAYRERQDVSAAIDIEKGKEPQTWHTNREITFFEEDIVIPIRDGCDTKDGEFSLIYWGDGEEN